MRPSNPLDHSRGHGIREDPRKHKRANAAWRRTVRIGAAIAATVLMINIGVLIWTVSSFPWSSDGIITIYSGSCSVAKRTTLWVGLAINVASTALLAASNNCAQLLSSPTRTDIDKAHARNKWMDVGVPSIRNLFHIPRWRATIWVFLLLSSVPLHLLYNSVFFNTLSANDYQAALVTHEFLEGGWWNKSRVASTLHSAASGSSEFYSLARQSHSFLHIESWVKIYPEQLQDMQNHLSRLQRLDNEECLRAYGTSALESNWRNVLLVSNVTLPDNVVDVWIHSPLDANDETWVCNGRFGAQNVDAWVYGYQERCDVNSMLSKPSSWILRNVQQCQKGSISYNPRDCISMTAKVDYCLAEPTQPACTMAINTYLLAVVITCNVVKLVCLLVTASSRDFNPLATLGDAIVSFLDHPERLTRNLGPLSTADVRRGIRTGGVQNCNVSSTPFKRRRRRRASAVNIKRWILCIFGCISIMGVGVALFFLASKHESRSIAVLWAQGVGGLDISNIFAGPTGPASAGDQLALVFLANTPQAIVTFVELFYNNVLTCMLLAREWSRFSRVRKGLRVSDPVHGSAQRSTLWLQLPYRYILPLMATTAALHWVIGQSIFFVQMTVYDVSGVELSNMQVSGCTWSAIAIFLAMVIGAVLVVFLIGISLFKLEPGIPLASSCSLAISAATQTGADENNASLQALMYGVVQDMSSAPGGRERVGFSSKPVTPLVDGKCYS